MSTFHPHEIKVREGFGNAKGLRIAIVVSRFNDMVTGKLLEGALSALSNLQAETDKVEVYKVPGAWEMPVIVGELIRQRRIDAIVCLGCVVRGDTPHFDYVAGENARGINHLSSISGIPVANGVLTTNTMEQALERAGGIMGNKGAEAVAAAVEMAHLLRDVAGTRG
jgi:6,7-dimethyl-8-ribityllumazine synthase